MRSHQGQQLCGSTWGKLCHNFHHSDVIKRNTFPYPFILGGNCTSRILSTTVAGSSERLELDSTTCEMFDFLKMRILNNLGGMGLFSSKSF